MAGEINLDDISKINIFRFIILSLNPIIMKLQRIFLTVLILVVIGADAFGQRERSERSMTKPYYLQKGFISLNGGFYYFQRQKTLSLPLFLNPDITVARNITVGPLLTYFKYKHYVQYDENSTGGVKTLYPDDLTTYNHILVAVKGTYHFNDIFTKLLKIEIPKQYGLYASVFAGYNIVSVKSDSELWTATKDYEDSNMKAGFSVGIRFLHNKKFGGFMEYGVNSYGYGAFGLTWLISREKF